MEEGGGAGFRVQQLPLQAAVHLGLIHRNQTWYDGLVKGHHYYLDSVHFALVVVTQFSAHAPLLQDAGQLQGIT